MSGGTGVHLPRYAPISLDPGGRRHLLVTDMPAPPPTGGVELLDVAEIWTVVGTDGSARDPACRPHDSREHLLERLAGRLSGETMGLRLYAMGTEHFVWSVRALAERVGMGGAEIFLFALGAAGRRVWCAHCQTITEGVTTEVLCCAGCGRVLHVRGHFSPRLNAYQGLPESLWA